LVIGKISISMLPRLTLAAGLGGSSLFQGDAAQGFGMEVAHGRLQKTHGPSPAELLSQEVQSLRWSEADLQSRRKGDQGKVAIARRLSGKKPL
jgi:hypothetical protein